MVQVSTINKAIVASCAVGLLVCFYAYTVERRKTEDPSYVAMCDLDERMSCSRVLTSPYAKGFGLLRFFVEESHPLNVPNSIPGIALFAVFAALCKVESAWSARVQIGLGIASNIASVYLAGILFYVLQDFCVLCVATYALNFFNLIFAFLRLRALTPKSAKQKGQQKSQKQQKKQQNEKQKSPKAEKKKQQQQQSEKQKSPQAEKQKQQQQNGKVKNQEKQKQQQQQQQQQQQNGKVKNQQNGKQSEKQKSPKTPNSKKKN